MPRNVKPEDIIPGLRAIIAKKLVNEKGFPKKKTAEILGLSPPAITLYLQGKRAGDLVDVLSRPEVAEKIDDFVECIVDKNGKASISELYDLAFDVISVLEKETVSEDLGSRSLSSDRKKLRRLLRTLRERVEVEQRASEDFMRVASNLNNNLLRMIIRMIARDCIKHADLISIAAQIIESEKEVEIDLIDRQLLSKLLAQEEKYHVHGLDDVRDLIEHPLLKIIIDYVESDERKHEKTLKSLLEYISSLGEAKEKSQSKERRSSLPPQPHSAR